MDTWVTFKDATKWQAESIFKTFFSSCASQVANASQENITISVNKADEAAMLTEVQLAELAKRFAIAIPEEKLSVGQSLSSLIIIL